MYSAFVKIKRGGKTIDILLQYVILYGKSGIKSQSILCLER